LSRTRCKKDFGSGFGVGIGRVAGFREWRRFNGGCLVPGGREEADRQGMMMVRKQTEGYFNVGYKK